ncbi:MAG: hypothetical protein ACXVW7_18730 [Trebonia sp.]
MTTATPRLRLPWVSARIPVLAALVLVLVAAALVAVALLAFRSAPAAPAPAAYFTILHSVGDTCATSRPGTPC